MRDLQSPLLYDHPMAAVNLSPSGLLVAKGTAMWAIRTATDQDQPGDSTTTFEVPRWCKESI
jgi:hypothetical protein